MPRCPERDLVVFARRGSRSAFGELMRRYRPPIYALALHLCGSTHDADDVAQETLLRAWAKLHEFQGVSRFYTWLYRIAVNLSLNTRRHRGRRQTIPLDDPRVALAIQVDAAGDARRAMELREVYIHLMAALDTLSEPLQLAVVLVALQGMTHEQAGAVLGCTSGTVAWRIHTARQRLAIALGPKPGNDDSGLLARWVPAFSR